MIKNCIKCGTVFSAAASDFCADCQTQMFHVVAAYLKDHRTANALDVARDTSTPLKLVLEFVRIGSLKINRER